jgi:ribosome biogenesis GTPase
VIGQVLYGINNIYTVASEKGEIFCRIKGKILKTEEGRYNPIAVGDWVRIALDSNDPGVGWIEGLEERQSWLVRYNKKRRAPQVIAANVDMLVCVASTKNPPFRPRFIDRMLVSAKIGNVTPVIFANKWDLGIGGWEKRRLSDYRRIGYRVIRGSALTGKGIGALRRRLRGRSAVFAGQSGVGKTALLNCLDPELKLKVGEVSRKRDRGAHTTSYAVMVSLNGGIRVIDTPGIRELDVYGIIPQDLSFYFPEVVGPAKLCDFNPCHHFSEPGCAVRRAAERGKIHPDRYESYKRIFLHLKEMTG